MADLKACFSHKTEEHYTPLDKFAEWNKEFNFDCDPCAPPHNPLGLPNFWTKEQNGLMMQWGRRNFINPPYGPCIEEWIKWGNLHFDYGKADLNVYLLPARTDTRWFHDYIYNKPNVEIRFLKGRLKFGNGKGSAPFPSMLVIMRRPEPCKPTGSFADLEKDYQLHT